jgi:hypothetical protein
VYLDGGSASEIMFEHCFDRLEEKTRSKMRVSNTPLVGFSSEKVHPMGELTLPVTVGKGRFARTEDMNFLVVRAASRYHVIIGRSGISALGAVVSTAHAMMRFPTIAGVCTIQPDIDCRLIADSEEDKSGVSINRGYPDQTIQIGPNLYAKGKRDLVKLLQESRRFRLDTVRHDGRAKRYS